MGLIISCCRSLSPYFSKWHESDGIMASYATDSLGYAVNYSFGTINKAVPTKSRDPPSHTSSVNSVGKHQSSHSQPIGLNSGESTTHVTRSNYRYMHDELYISPQLSKAFSDAYRYFEKGEKVPDEIMTKLSEFIIDSKTFRHLATMKEAKFVYLEDGLIRFDECTLPPHGEVIVEVVKQIEAQNVPTLFRGGTGNGTIPV